MMDVTSVFKECLSQNKKAQLEVDSILTTDNGKGGKFSSEKKGFPSQSSVFPGKKSEHFSKAKEISGNITKLRDFLKECRTAYVNVGTFKHASFGGSSVFSGGGSFAGGKSDVPIMSDRERDQIDNDVTCIIQSCQKALHDYQIVVESSNAILSQPQLHTHLENVVNSLTNYLKRVTEIYSEMRAIRVKRTVDYQAMSRLATHSTSSKGLNNSKSSIGSSATEEKAKLSSDWEKPFRGSISSAVSETDGLSSMSGSNRTEADTTVPTYFQDDDDAMSPEELQMLEQENAALLNELNTLSQEVEQIESNVVQIAQLQEIFTEKVLQQEKDIDRIGTMIVNATENIRGGNEQVRQAIQKSADFRAYVLFFIMVMSFSLLFLDWYND